MVRKAWALVFAGLFGAVILSSTAGAFEVPGVKKAKKEVKEKSDDAQKTAGVKEDAPPPAANNQNTTTTQPAAAQPAAGGDTAPAPKQEAGAAPAIPETTTEMTITKEAWEEYKKNKVGTFVEYSMPAQPGMKMRSEVIDMGADYIVVKQTTSSPQFSQVSKSKMVVKDLTEKVTVKGKEFTATRMDMSTNGQVVSRSWSSKEIPNLMGGMVKSEAQGAVNMELSDYGWGK